MLPLGAVMRITRGENHTGSPGTSSARALAWPSGSIRPISAYAQSPGLTTLRPPCGAAILNRAHHYAAAAQNALVRVHKGLKLPDAHPESLVTVFNGGDFGGENAFNPRVPHNADESG